MDKQRMLFDLTILSMMYIHKADLWIFSVYPSTWAETAANLSARNAIKSRSTL